LFTPRLPLKAPAGQTDMARGKSESWQAPLVIGAAAGVATAALLILFKVFAGHPLLEILGTAAIASVIMAIVGTIVFVLRNPSG